MKGVTDLPIALAALIFGLLLKKQKRNDWMLLFLLVALSAVMGAAVHLLRLTPTVRRIVWTVLYALLYEDIRRFSLLMTAYISGCRAQECRAVWWTEGLLYLCTILVLMTHELHSIYILVVFMVIMLVRIAVCLARYRFRPARATGLMTLLVFPVTLQALADVISAAVVAEHLLIVAGQVIAYSIGLRSAEPEKV